jgi:hypothetical protein
MLGGDLGAGLVDHDESAEGLEPEHVRPMREI